MFNISALLKFINVNNDGKIQKSEVEQFVSKLEKPSIFSDYFDSISSDLDIDTFGSDIFSITQKLTDENNDIPDFDFKDKNDKTKYEELTAAESRDKDGYFPYINITFDPQIITSYNELPLGSHSNIRNAQCCNITRLNLNEKELLDLCVDKTAVMTPKQRAMIEPYMEAAKNPGLGIRQLHEQGFTGKGVNIAIIDMQLGKHKEYEDNLIGQVHDINAKESFNRAQLHGAAVASIAVGKTVGVAPDAGLVYYAADQTLRNPEKIQAYRENIQQEIETCNDPQRVEKLQNELNRIDKALNENKSIQFNKPYVEAINKILDENEKLPENERVPVISISWGFDRSAPDYEELLKAVERAKKQGVFVVSTAMREHYGMSWGGANRDPKGDLDNPNSYEAGAWCKKDAEKDPKEYKDKTLLVPMDHRTVADFLDGTSYRYEGNDGGGSWAIPWFAGMYALAKQADSNITPEKFWQYALETSNECHNNDSGVYVGRIINPQGLIQKIQENKTIK